MHLRTPHSAAAAEPAALSLAPLDVPLIVELGRALDAAAVAEACRGWEGVVPRPSSRLTLRVERAPELAGCGEVSIAMSGSAMEI
jgi:hypothetical protein